MLVFIKTSNNNNQMKGDPNEDDILNLGQIEDTNSLKYNFMFLYRMHVGPIILKHSFVM